MKKIVFILLYFMLLVPFSSWSQKPSQDFRFVSIKEGIPKTGVYTIVQDHYGFMWIGTNGTGLYKFDGIDYTVYKHDLQDSTSLSSNRVMTSYLDKKDRNILNGNINLINKRSFYNKIGFSSTYVILFLVIITSLINFIRTKKRWK